MVIRDGGAHWHTNPCPPTICIYCRRFTERKVLEDTIRTHAGELEAEVERRALRISELEQRRMQVEKLAALAQVAAGIAHEINNPLASIAQSMVILKRALPETHPKYKYTRKIQECTDRISHIIHQLYKLYKPDPSIRAHVDIRESFNLHWKSCTLSLNNKGFPLHLRFPIILSLLPLHGQTWFRSCAI